MKKKYDFTHAERGKFYNPKTIFDYPNFVRSLNKSAIRGVPGKSLLQFAGTIPTDDLRLMSQIIEEGCEEVDLEI